jgi:mannose-1-phosphate guanylyltransferase/mannose-6-phosphate isomerase
LIMTQDIYPVLLCGGAGTRLWPLSRKSYPKQFARITDEESLFQASARRLSGAGFAAPYVITGSDFRFIVTEQLAAVEMAPAAILIEPCARNTAPAICAAALALEAREPGALMLVAPSDHVIPDAARFRSAVQAAAPAAQAGNLVTFGIRPDRPETGYGWLEMSKAPDAEFSPIPQSLRAFVEKPDHPTAASLLADGRHLWNAGIFLFSTTAILDAFTASHNPMDWNGMKMVRAGAAPLDAANGLARIQSLAEADDFGSAQSGTYQDIAEEARKAYVARVLSFVDVAALTPLKILVNAGNGAAGPTFDAIAAELAAQGAAISFVRLHHTPDGSFPNGIPPSPASPPCPPYWAQRCSL